MEKTKAHSMSIDDILESVRNVINAKNDVADDDSPCEELELINIAEKPAQGESEADESILSKESKDQSQKTIREFIETAETFGKEINIPSEQNPSSKSIENFVLELMKPQIKEWLDANLPTIVKQIVSDEVKKLVADVNKNSR